MTNILPYKYTFFAYALPAFQFSPSPHTIPFPLFENNCMDCDTTVPTSIQSKNHITYTHVKLNSLHIHTNTR
jgi:hypothetical protein